MKTFGQRISLFLLISLMLSKAYLHAQPNVVYIMADDLGWKDLSIHGSDIPTPHVDSIFKQGVELSNFMAWSVCSPTRGGLLTGIHPLKSNMGPETNGHLDKDTVTIADAFKANGYRTGAFGKWHNGEACWKDAQGNPILDVAKLPAPAKNKFKRTPYLYSVNDHGFDEWAGFYGGGTTYKTKEVYNIPNWFHNELYVPSVWDSNAQYKKDKNGYVTDLIGDYSVKFINRSVNASKPFFCYVPFSAPHSTPVSGAKYEYRNPGNPDRRIPNGRSGDDAKYAEMVILMDDQVGRILDELTRLGIKNNTIVVFTSDNGGTKMGNNKPFKGEKHTTWEGGYHVPTAIRWNNGGLTGGTKYRGLMGFLDVFPTMMSMCNLSMPTGLNIDGKNVWDSQNKRLKANSPVKSFFLSFKNSHMIRTETFKYLMNEQGGQALYNLNNDPGESKNIKSGNGAKFNELKNMANNFMSSNEIKLSHIAHKVPASDYSTASGDVLRVRINKSSASLSKDYYFKISSKAAEPYWPGGHDATHYLAYDIFVPNASKNMRFNITLSSSPDKSHWMEDFGAVDSYGRSLINFPNGGYSKAINKWHRYYVGTGNYAPRNSGKLHVKLHKDSPKGTYDFFIDNASLQNRAGKPVILWENGSHTGLDIPKQSGVSVTVSTVSANYIASNFPNYNDSHFEGMTVPGNITAGSNFTANVSFRNIGNSVWTAGKGFKLGSENAKDNERWGVSRGLIGGGASVQPGQVYTFQVQCTAPKNPGTYNMQWRMVREGVAWFGPATNNKSITVVGEPDNDAPVPNPMTWSVLPTADGTSISMTATIATDKSGVEYYFSETSGNPGGSDSGWQNSRQYTDSGLTAGLIYSYTVRARDKSSNRNATSVSNEASAIAAEDPPPPPVVLNDAMFVSQEVPYAVRAGSSFNIPVTFVNTGDSTWSNVGGFALGSASPLDNKIWGSNRASLIAQVAPGESYTFNVPCVAPASAGAYTFQRRMVEEGAEWFGDRSSQDEIAVVVPSVAALKNWGNYKFKLLPYAKMSGFQDIKYNESQTGTTQFLIFDGNHGTATTRNKEAIVIEGGWEKIVYVGDDSKSLEIWKRNVTSANKNSLGMINSFNGKGKLSILSYQTLLSTGNVKVRKLNNKKISINNDGAAPFLVVAVTKNGQNSKISNKRYGVSKLDRVFIYLTNNVSFSDNSVGKVKGAMASIDLRPYSEF